MTQSNDPKLKDDVEAHAHAEPHHSEFDEVVHVPKGQSKLRFYLLLGLTILVLLIFTVGSEIQQSVAKKGGVSDTRMIWNDPINGPQQISETEFKDELIRFEDFNRVTGNQQARQNEIDAVASIIITDRLAQDAGVEVTVDELSKTILQGNQRILPRGFFSAEYYKAALAQSSVSAASFEFTLKRMLRIARYEQMLMALRGVADPDAIEKIWKEQHQQFAFDYVELSVADYIAEAEKQMLDDAALEDWYLKLPNRMQLFADLVQPEKRAAEVAGFRVNSEDKAAGLLAKFPPKADRDVESEAKAYYDGVHDRRFRRAEPLKDAPDEATKLYSPYAEVSETCKREAPIYNALRDWLADLDKRATTNETIDLQKEAADLGLYYQTDEGLRTRDEWSKIGGLYGDFLAAAILSAGTQTNLTNQVVVEAGGFSIARVKNRAVQSLPALSQAKERVQTEWKKKKAAELAKAKLDDLRKTFPIPADEKTDAKAPPKEKLPKVDADAFAKAVEAAGLKVTKRDYAEAAPKRGADPKLETPAMAYFTVNSALYGLSDGEVASAALDAKNEHAYLVRFAGKRDPTEIAIEPGEYEFLKMRAEYDSFLAYSKANLSPEAYVKRFGLKVRGSSTLPAP